MFFVQLETDSMIAVQKITGVLSNSEPYADLISAIRELLHRNWSCSITHVYREANRCADWMATNASTLHAGLHVFYNPPKGVNPSLLADAQGSTRKTLL